jgi:hypothetical protein
MILSEEEAKELRQRSAKLDKEFNEVIAKADLCIEESIKNKEKHDQWLKEQTKKDKELEKSINDSIKYIQENLSLTCMRYKFIDNLNEEPLDDKVVSTSVTSPDLSLTVSSTDSENCVASKIDSRSQIGSYSGGQTRRLGSNCYKCNGSGHFARDCTELVQCYNCRKHGHIAKHCPEKRKSRINILIILNLICITEFLFYV